jgi:hypothetical protein
MMGQRDPQGTLFYQLSLETFVPDEHPHLGGSMETLGLRAGSGVTVGGLGALIGV